MTPPIMTDDIVIEILSWLPVKSLLRFKCVNKSFQSFISDPKFVKLHLQRSSKRVNFLTKYYSKDTMDWPLVLPCPISSLLEDSSPHIANELSPIDMYFEHYDDALGSCNGLVCSVAESNIRLSGRTVYEGRTFLLWNPSTRQTFGDPLNILKLSDLYMLGFGYDNVSDTYKVVAILFTLSSEDGSPQSNEVKVCNISDDNCWRNIQCFPANPVRTMQGDGVSLNSTLNWIALALQHNHDNDSDIRFGELVIVSLDLRNETYTQMSLPPALDGVLIHDFNTIGHGVISNVDHVIMVLKDCLSLFLHNIKTDHFCIWQMKEFGDKQSWNPLLNIATQDLQIDYLTHRFYLQPLCVFENGCILIVQQAFDRQLQAILYDGRDNTVKHSEIPSNIREIYAKDYVQSLVSPRKY